MGRAFNAGLAAALLLMALACVARDEVARVPSPDGRLDAVLWEINAGATVSFSYVVKIQERGKTGGQRVMVLDGAYRNEDAYGANIKWLSNTKVGIEFLGSDEYLVVRDSVELAGRRVDVVAHPGVRDPAAPPGSMGRNLRRPRRASP